MIRINLIPRNLNEIKINKILLTIGFIVLIAFCFFPLKWKLAIMLLFVPLIAVVVVIVITALTLIPKTSDDNTNSKSFIFNVPKNHRWILRNSRRLELVSSSDIAQR